MSEPERIAERMARLEPSAATARVLALAERPDVISFAGGLPDPRTFPVEAIRQAAERALRDEPGAALNYGPNPGSSRLRERIAAWMTEREGLATEPPNVIVTSGGVEALLLLGSSLVDPGDVVLVGAPTYMAALHVLRWLDARLVAVPLDEEGLDVDALEATLRRLEAEGLRPKLLYTIPSFQNPTGLTLGAARRGRLVELAEKYGFVVAEDHAYAELRYDGPPLPSVAATAGGTARVVLLHTFSKIVAPGLRLGWAVAPPRLVETMGLAKLGTDQCANTLTQRIVADLLDGGGLEGHIERSRRLYRAKRDRLLAALARHLPAGARWTRPEGGFYVWVRLGETDDAVALYDRALREEKTAFVAGPIFFVDGEAGRRFLRLSFSFVDEEKIDEGVRRLGRALHGSGAL